MEKFNFLFISVFIFMLISSCEKDNFQANECVSTKSVINANPINSDTIFLGCEGDLHDPAVIWRNMKVYSPAYDRMVKHVKIVNNQLTWDFKNAKELNISQNIFDYVTFMWNIDNEKLSTGNYSIEKYGIYFIVKAKDPGIMLLTGQILMRGRDDFNYNVCLQIVQNVTSGWLGNYIDLENSEMIPDNYGGLHIAGEGKTGKKTYYYYATNASPLNPKHRLNYIVTLSAYEDMRYFYKSVLNFQHAPLVHVRIS